MNFKAIVFLLALSGVLTFPSCNPIEEEVSITDETIKADFQAISLDPGVKDVRIEVAKDIFYNFRVIIPDVDLNQEWPLIFAFHGAAGGSPIAHQQTECYLEPGFEEIDAFIIHPNADQNEWFDVVNQSKVRTLLSLSTQFWPIDFDKIAVTGYSNGGNMSWLMAEVAFEAFSAAIPIASSYDISLSETTSKKMPIPMYVIHGEDDELFPIDITRTWVEQSIEAGSDITFVQADSLTHFRPCDYVPYIQDAVVWLKEVWE